MGDVYQNRVDKEAEELSRDFSSIRDKYAYPAGVDLHPNSPTHGTLLSMLMMRGMESRAVVDRVKPEWRKYAMQMEGYVPLDEAEVLVKENDSRKPVRIVVPQSWATRERLKTTMAGIFLRNPIHPLKPGGPEDYYGALLLERILQRQAIWFKEALHWMTIFGNAFTYGIGPAELRWKRHYVTRVREQYMDPMLTAIRVAKGSKIAKDQEGQLVKYMSEELQYEGSQLKPIDPFNFLPDPNITPNNLQDSEYLGHVWHTNALNIVEAENEPGSDYFNGIFVRIMAQRGLSWSRLASDYDSGRGRKIHMENIRETISPWLSHKVDMFTQYMKIVPREFGLSDKTTPEIWEFEIAGDRIIVKAKPCAYEHGMFPMINCAPTTDGHDTVPVSFIGMLQGMQEFMDFLVTSNITSLRKNLNGMFAVDPSAFHWDDLLNPGPGMLLRMKPHVGGTGRIDQYIHQFESPDVTGQNIKNAEMIQGLYKDTSGLSDLVQGSMSGLPERPTAALGSTAVQNAFSRLQMLGVIIGEQCFYDVGRMSAFNCRQYMSQSTTVEVAGRYEQLLRQLWGGSDFAPVTLHDINVDFDIIPLDGSAPGTENAGAWTSIIQAMLQNQEIAMQIFAGLDVTKVFAEWARMTGAGNVLDFIRAGGPAQQGQIGVQPDQQVQQQAQAGNLVPMSQMQGRAAA